MGNFLLLLCLSFFVHLHTSEGCDIEGVTQWLEPQHFHFKDTHSGIIISQNTERIQGINSINFAEGLNRGPYLQISLSNSVLTVATTDAFAQYEEYETQLSIRFTVTFSCTGTPSIRVLTYVFNINDTNNHAPVFTPTNSFEYPLSLPVPPGFKVSGCDYIIVRDIDLTTQSIDFAIQENDYFEIVYYGQIQPKEFGAFIRTKTFIRSLAESLSFTMEATDVDLTEDDPLTTSAVVKIVADNAFRLPDTPVFSAAFYEADYTKEHDLILRQEYISLREGYDDQVQFRFEGEYANHFNLVNNDNRLSFQVNSPLPEDISESQILLVVEAEREFTTGARATVVVHLPEDIKLQFELPLYEGQIKDNALRAPDLTLLYGYEEISEINIINEYASYFLANREANIITLSMNPLPTAVIQNNNVLNIQVVVSTNNNVSASTIVVLEIIKDDYITPVFERSRYDGTYNSETGLALEPIVFLQGFDNTVSVTLKGDHSTYFDKVMQNSEIKLTASIPPEIWSERTILITVEAEKPRTVGANTAVLINLPTARKLSFEEPAYRGRLENNEVSLEIIKLSLGYEADVTFDLSGEFSSYFIPTNTQNQVFISLQSEVPEHVLLENNALMLSLIASGPNALSTSTNILLDIIRDDHVTPVFEKAVYNGIYESTTGLSLEQIVIIQGYDDTVEVIFGGDEAQWFSVHREGPNTTLSGTIPPEIWPQRNLILTLKATKPRTVGANSAIHITLPAARDLRFEKPSYRGSLENNELSLEIIELSLGYETDVTFELSGEFSSYFTVTNTQNQVTITLQSEIPENIILENNALMLSLTASGLNALTTSTNILLDIIRENNITPVFEKALYNGIYDSTTGLSLEEIVIIQGYDDTIEVALNGDHNQLFTLQQEGPRINLNGNIPRENWPEQYMILTLTATKPGTVGAHTAIRITLPAARKLSFQEASYRGSLEDNEVSLEIIELSLGYEEDVSFDLSGEFSSYFAINNTLNQVIVTLKSELPEEIILENNALMLSLTASGLNALTTSTNILLDIIQNDHVTPVFEKAVYNGVYDSTTGLSLEEIVIVQGYDDTVELVLNGDHAQLFSLEQEGPTITLTGSISPEVWSEQNIILTLKATKPRTVGANAVVHITLPAARLLSFEKSAYTGNFKNNIITIEEIILSVGYDPNVVFNLMGEHSDHFILSNAENKLSISLNTPLTEEFISENNFIVLTISASGLNAVSTVTTVLLEIIKDDTTTPVFSQHIYRGIYINKSNFEAEQISLIQGYDNTVSFSLEGDHAQYFEIDDINNKITLSIKTAIPEEIIFKEKLLLFKISAEKDLTVGATSIVSIQFPTELTEPAIMGFSQSAYVGSLNDDNVEITGMISLETGYRPDTQFNLLGEYAEYFTLTSLSNVITVSIGKPLPMDQLRDTDFIVLEIEAQRVRAVTVTTAVVIDIMNTDTIIFPVFEKPLYSGTFNREDGLKFEDEIRLAIGFDETVTFTLEGDDSQWFTLKHISSNSVGLSLNAEGLPQSISRNYLIFSIVATKPDNIAGRSAILISLTGRSLRFLHDHYNGYIEEAILSMDIITLEKGYYEDVDFSLIGDYNDYFQITNQDGNVTVKLVSELPREIGETYNVLIFSLEARTDTFRTHTTLVIEMKSTANTRPGLDFENTYYTGSYSQEKGLTFDSLIIIPGELNDPIQFNLEGENAVWFGLELRSNNSVALTLMSPIPPAVMEKNRKLIFAITATRPESVTARATIVISLTDEHTILAFEQSSYTGSIDNDALNLKPVVLREGFTAQVSFALRGDLTSHFVLDSNGPIVTLKLQVAIPEELIPHNGIILLELQASAAQAMSAVATIVLTVNGTNDTPVIEHLSFEETYYTGVVTEKGGLSFNRLISLSHGYDDRVILTLEGDNSIWFGLELQSNNSVALILISPIPAAVLENNRKLIFTITATRPESVMARSTIVISLMNEHTILAFEQSSYTGSIDNDVLHLKPVVLREGFTAQVSFTLRGDLMSHFVLDSNGPIVTLKLQVAIPEELIPHNGIILLELQASAAQAISAVATIVLTVNGTNDTPVIEHLSFEETYYTGVVTEQGGLSFDRMISLSHGYDDRVTFTLEGDNSIWFGLELQSNNSVALILISPIPAAVLENNRKLIFTITATRPESVMARSTIVISLMNEHTILAFEQSSYIGSIDNDALNLKPVVLHEGFTAQVSFTLRGDLTPHFVLDSNGPIVTLKLQVAIPEELIPHNGIILLELQASAAQAISAVTTIVLTVNGTNDTPVIEHLSFEETYYTGVVTEQGGLSFNRLISLSHGYYDRVILTLEGDNSIWFGLQLQSKNSVALILISPIPAAVLENNRKLIFTITATRPESVMARAAIVISVAKDSSTDPPSVTFDKILYNGIIRLGNVMHESITISGYNGTTIDISGQYAALFEAKLTDNEIVITTRPSEVLPDVSHIVLELQAGSAGAVLVLDIIDPETPVLPTVTFGSPSYVLRVDVTHAGSVGRVQATSDNGEAITYSLNINDDHLRARLTISNEGELRLSAPANSGMYSFQVIAKTVITGASATAPVHLGVEAATVCGGDIVVPPLIILERDEEKPHRNLVMLNEPNLEGCQFTLSNIWPKEQTWLYVDEDGLHTTSIDREHESIAFMTVSQIQVELILGCEGDVTSRSKRSLRSKSTADWLGPYEYGTNKWILSDSIRYNARRSLVNLIVNDINDNAPIFVGKENEPIVVGYPVAELESIILPTALVELKATDADIGENAALIYWSTEESLAVSPSTGFVHIRNSSNLQNDARFTVHATDQNGAGHTGSLELMVKLLEKNHIAVLNIRNAFLENEEQILGNLSNAAGYEVKTLKTMVVSESISSRDMRDASIGLAASLQLYVYGLVEREPVEIKQLIADINNDVTAVNVANIISLEDHLKRNEICVVSGRDNGLLAATIVLSVLIFILIVAIAVWYFLKRRKNNNYEQFNDRNSIASRNVSLEEPKSEMATKPRINIEDLKRSERRLQERLDAPVTDISTQPSGSNEKPMEAIINISTPDPQLPIIIQTIDKLKDNTEESEDDDEFGERMKSRRKSVVTFNENVEKIIHVEENEEDKTVEDYEVFKL